MRTKTRGFTIIELLLAMTFLTSILIISSTVIVQAFGIYNKGLVIKQINQLGRTLTEDMTRVANNAVITDGDVTGGGTHVLCLGSTVYAWNTPKHPVADQKKFSDGEVINFVKISSSSACSSTDDVDRTLATDLLSENIRVLSATITPASGANNVINVEFVFGTYDENPSSSINPREIPAGSGDWQCDGSGMGNYCAFGVYSTTLYLPNRGE